MYKDKDKDKQREANKKAKARQREREGMTITLANVIPQVIPKKTTQGNIRVSKPGDAKSKAEYARIACHSPQCGCLKVGKRGKDIKCFEDLPPDVQQTIDRMSTTDGKLDKNEKAKRTAAAIKYQHLFPDSYESAGDLDFTRLMAKAGPGHVRVSKPGDDDYVPQCETTRRFIEGRGAAL